MSGRDGILAAGALVLGYVLLSRQRPAPTPAPAEDPLGGLGGVYGEIAKAGLPIVTKQLQDRASPLRQRLRQHGDAHQKVAHIFGLAKKPGQKKKARQVEDNREKAYRADMERFAARVHSYLVRPDVQQWQMNEKGDIWIFYRGQKKPWRVPVPDRAVIDRIAWAAEPVVRALGAFAQAGGRFTTPFVRHDPPAFSDANPYAPPHQTVSGRRALEESPEHKLALAKRLRMSAGKDLAAAKAAGIRFEETGDEGEQQEQEQEETA